MVRAVGDRAIYSQPDIRLNDISWQAKNRNSTRVKNPNGFIQSSETGLKIPIFIDGMAPADTYGIPGKSKFTISIKLPSSDGIREGWTGEDFWRKMGEVTFEFQAYGRTTKVHFNHSKIQKKINGLIAQLSASHRYPKGEPRIEKRSKNGDCA